MIQLGENIRILRKINKMNQNDLALELDVSQTSIAHYEKGDRQPTIENLMKMSEFFDISIDELVGNKRANYDQLENVIHEEDIHKLLDYLIHKNEAAFYEKVTQISLNLDMKTIILKVLQKVMYLIGNLWEQGKITEADEHYATHIVRKSINSIYMKETPVIKKSKAIAMAVHTEKHTMGLEMVTSLLEKEGVETLYLGENVTLRSLNHMINEFQPDYILVSVTIKEHINSLLTLIEGIIEKEDMMILIGGQGVKDIEDDIFSDDRVFVIDSLNQLLNVIHS